MSWETLKDMGNSVGRALEGVKGRTEDATIARRHKPNIDIRHSLDQVTRIVPWVVWISAAYVRFPWMLTRTFSRRGKEIGVSIL